MFDVVDFLNVSYGQVSRKSSESAAFSDAYAYIFHQQ